MAENPSELCPPLALRIHKIFASQQDSFMKICENAGKYENSLLPDENALPNGKFRDGDKETYRYNEFMESLNKNLQQIDKTKKCLNESTSKLNQVNHPHLILEKTAVGAIPLTIVSEDEVNTIFKNFAVDPQFAFNSPADGCWARAHIMDRELERKGIRAGKVFIEGALKVFTKNAPNGKFVIWKYHVAPILAVQTEDGVQLRVVDPSLFDKPVPVNEWTDVMFPFNELKLRSKVYITDRFPFYALRGKDLQKNIDDPAKGRWHIAETLKAEAELLKWRKYEASQLNKKKRQ